MQTTSVGKGSNLMPQRRMMLLAAVVCAVVALVATLWVSQRNQSSSNPTVQMPEVKKVSLIAAARDLPKGTRISSADVRLVELPENQVPKDAVTDIESAKGSILIQEVSKDEPIRHSLLMPPPERLREFNVPIGLRGFVLYQPFTEGAADILLPGDLVDVIATRRLGDTTVAEVIVRRAQVLVAENYVPGKSREEMVRQRILSSAEQRTPSPPEPQMAGQLAQTSPESETKAVATMRRIVLAVTPPEAVRLARAIEEGRALTVLRNERDYFLTPPLKSPSRVSESTAQRHEPAKPNVQPVPTVPPMKPVRTVVVYRGTEREEIIVSR
ncbi:MAG: Flp pilus assembly protein CpaB [Armatimonadota bacterium]|nr:Flp pilus assembly protein CpaB [Armatimonadota bacterium]